MRAPLGRTRESLGRDVLACYADAPLGARAHVHVRWATCPFRAVVAQLPAGGRVLEIGCGHGLFSLTAALDGAGRRAVRGIDVDGAKISHGRRAAARARERGVDCSLEVAPPGVLPDGPWDAIAIVDVLYLLEAAAQRLVVAQAAASLAPGGLLLIKEVDGAPAWKFGWNVLQETLAVRVLGITAGSSMTFLGAAGLGAAVEDAGLSARHRPLHRGYP
ncbi:MAG: class I SAM-dependent methyltransferase, partial [Actinomycetota bacterium]|nr:class I SAM-dependent methyltransferase [Actinomycetota bacterium]